MDYVLSTVLGLYKDIHKIIDNIYIDIIIKATKEKYFEKNNKIKRNLFSLLTSHFKYSTVNYNRKSYIMTFDSDFDYIKDMPIGEVIVKSLPNNYNINVNDIIYLLRTTSDTAIFAVGSIYEIKKSIDCDDNDLFKWNCAITITTQLPKYLSFEYIKSQYKSLDFTIHPDLYVKEISTDENDIILDNIKQHIEYNGVLPNKYNNKYISKYTSKTSFPYSASDYCCKCCDLENDENILTCSSCNRGFHFNCILHHRNQQQQSIDNWKCQLCILKGENKYTKGNVCEICYKTLSTRNTKFKHTIKCKTCERIYHTVCLNISNNNMKDWECRLCNGYRNRIFHLPENDEWCCICNNNSNNNNNNNNIHTCYCCKITRHDSCPDPYSNMIGCINIDNYTLCKYCYNKYIRHFVFYKDVKRYIIKMECEAVVYRLIKNYVMGNIDNSTSTNKIITIFQISKLLLSDYLSSL